MELEKGLNIQMFIGRPKPMAGVKVTADNFKQVEKWSGLVDLLPVCDSWVFETLEGDFIVIHDDDVSSDYLRIIVGGKSDD